MPGSKDRFEDLPEHVLELLLSFLPSQDAVRTSVLARRWRTLWKSVPALRLDGFEFESAQVFSNFVNKLLEHRDRTSPLHECEIFPYPEGEEDEAHHDVQSWAQYAVSCRVSVLRVRNEDADYPRLKISNSSVISKDLTRLELYNLAFGTSRLDLISCEALEVLEISGCFINIGDNLPKSLRHLKIRDSDLYSMQTPRNCLSAPGLLTFELADCAQWTPLLESLPSLVTSFIRINMECKDACTHIKYLADCGDESCQGCYGEEDHCLLLEGLAGATNLELISQYSVIFRKDLKWCPMFSKLKTVLLNEWCLTANFTGLLYFLQHTPILEKLTLQLPSCKDFDIGSNGSYNPVEYFLVSKHLKVVEIHCSKEDEWTCQIVNILGTHGVTSVRNREDEWICQIVNILGIHGVTSAQISIKHDSWSSFRFSFQQSK